MQNTPLHRTVGVLGLCATVLALAACGKSPEAALESSKLPETPVTTTPGAATTAPAVEAAASDAAPAASESARAASRSPS